MMPVLRGRLRGPLAVLAAVLATVTACSSSSKTTSPPTTSASTSASTPATGAATSAAGTATTAQVSVKSSRGYDGTTIKIAGIGTLSAGFGGAEIGAEARFKRFNDTNEIPGIKIQFVEMADDKGDPATGLAEVRRLITQDQVFAIVPDLSAFNPTSYMAAQHVPHVGYAFDDSYCSTSASASVWGFGYSGCIVPPGPPVMPDSYANLYKYVSAKTGKAHPTMVITSGDIQSGKNSARVQASAAEGAGFDVVEAKGNVPQVTSDYSPYVQDWIAADHGKQPDVIDCLLNTQCIGALRAVKGAGFTGTFYQTFGAVSVLAKPMAGTVTASTYATESSPALQQMEADFNAFKPGTQLLAYANVPAYFAADMFIQALKKVGRDITPEAVQAALDHQTWQITGLVGPLAYPQSAVAPSPTCNEILTDTDGTGYQVVEPYSCSTKTWPVDPKFTG
jgi:ABC-type branched-subunit amino acid transport system substrate-binding protein